MPKLRIMTFNVENLLVRFNFKTAQEDTYVSLLDVDSEVERANLIRNYFNILNDENRIFTALAIAAAEPDVICLQEVESLQALKSFHNRYLQRVIDNDYPYQILIEANDPRGIDVAILSRYKIDSVTSHQERRGPIKYPDKTKEERIFRRDCLEVKVKCRNKLFPLYICHFKSMMGGRKETSPIRRAEAQAVRDILVERFGDPAQHDWLVVGDLNDYTEADGKPDTQHALGALVDNGFAVDLVKRIADPLDRWTHYYDSDRTYHQLDYLLASPTLAAKNPTVIPSIIRIGQPYRASRYKGDRLPRVGYDRPKASDHCGVVAELDF